MSLRLSLALRILVMALPLFFGAQWLRKEWARSAEVENLTRVALEAMENGGKERCEQAPAAFGGPLPFGRARPTRGQRAPDEGPIFVWGYDAAFVSANPMAPPFPGEFAQALAGGADSASRFGDDGRGPPLQVGLRTGWSDGPAAFLLIQRREPSPPGPDRGPDRGQDRGPRPGQRGEGRPDPRPLPRVVQKGPSLWWQAGLLALALVGASAFAAWPLVRRIRKLTAAVQKSAADGYQTEVPNEGSDELAALARAFNEAGKSLRATIGSLHEQERALREFLANTTHDVMHPLSVLQGHLHNARKALEQGKAIDAATLNSCQEEAHFVASLVHNLTAAARLQSGVVPIDSRSLDLRKIVERAVARHRPMADSRGLALEVGVPADEVTVEGDMTLLEQAISNLVHNAVRHNTTGKQVAVLLESEPGQGSFVLSVLDDGPGVPESDLARLCERRFRTATAWRSSPEGTGIGLAIVREVAERHRMALELGLRPGGGFVAKLRGLLVTTPSGLRKAPGTPYAESRDDRSATR